MLRDILRFQRHRPQGELAEKAWTTAVTVAYLRPAGLGRAFTITTWCPWAHRCGPAIRDISAASRCGSSSSSSTTTACCRSKEGRSGVRYPEGPETMSTGCCAGYRGPPASEHAVQSVTRNTAVAWSSGIPMGEGRALRRGDRGRPCRPVPGHGRVQPRGNARSWKCFPTGKTG
jgi:hypothetical protein